MLNFLSLQSLGWFYGAFLRAILIFLDWLSIILKYTLIKPKFFFNFCNLFHKSKIIFLNFLNFFCILFNLLINWLSIETNLIFFEKSLDKLLLTVGKFLAHDISLYKVVFLFVLLHNQFYFLFQGNHFFLLLHQLRSNALDLNLKLNLSVLFLGKGL